MKNPIEVNEHMKQIIAELQIEQSKPAKRRNYFYMKLLEQELGFELACVIQGKGRHFI